MLLVLVLPVPVLLVLVLPVLVLLVLVLLDLGRGLDPSLSPIL